VLQTPRECSAGPKNTGNVFLTDKKLIGGFSTPKMYPNGILALSAVSHCDQLGGRGPYLHRHSRAKPAPMCACLGTSLVVHTQVGRECAHMHRALGIADLVDHK
jgi:hypothetical protein